MGTRSNATCHSASAAQVVPHLQGGGDHPCAQSPTERWTRCSAATPAPLGGPKRGAAACRYLCQVAIVHLALFLAGVSGRSLPLRRRPTAIRGAV